VNFGWRRLGRRRGDHGGRRFDRAGPGGRGDTLVSGGALGLLAGEVGCDLRAALALVVRQAMGVGRLGLRATRLRTAHVECGRTFLGRRRRGEIHRRRRADARPLGLDHHGLGPPVAEALLHGASAHGGAGARLQRQGGSTRPVLVFVRHALA
jgi:hypothetical protein